MKRIITSLAVLALCASGLFAQDKPAKLEKPFYLGIQGGPMFSLNENAWTYRENGNTKGLFTWQGSFVAGYDLNWKTGFRLTANYGKDVSGNNVLENNYGELHPYYPYDFKNISVFLDVTHNISNNPESSFVPKVYAGIGLGHTYGFNYSAPGHPQNVYMTENNNVFGFRFGFIAEYMLSETIGIYADLCGEAYTDKFNGLQPSKDDKRVAKGYPGFPLDLRGLCSLGIAFHF